MGQVEKQTPLTMKHPPIILKRREYVKFTISTRNFFNMLRIGKYFKHLLAYLLFFLGFYKISTQNLLLGPTIIQSVAFQ